MVNSAGMRFSGTFRHMEVEHDGNKKPFEKSPHGYDSVRPPVAFDHFFGNEPVIQPGNIRDTALMKVLGGLLEQYPSVKARLNHQQTSTQVDWEYAPDAEEAMPDPDDFTRSTAEFRQHSVRSTGFTPITLRTHGNDEAAVTALDAQLKEVLEAQGVLFEYKA